MKKILFACCAALLLASCTIETSGNGALDGFWHLEQVDTLTTGGVADLSEQLIFWGVQYKLLSLKDAKRYVNSDFYLRFEHSGDQLRVYQPYIASGHESDLYDGGDKPLENAALLAPYGINQLDETFHVDELKSGRMVLSTDQLRLHFRKF